MFSNLKVKKRLTQLLIAFVVVALTATGSALLLNDFVQEAKAADYTVSSVSEWNSYVGNAASGSTVNITLGADLKSTGTGALGLAAVPSGVTVNLYMNGKTIQWYNVATGNQAIISTSYPYANTYWGLITNNGTLKIEGTGTISQYQVRYNNTIGSSYDNYGHKSAAIVNKGTLDIGSGIRVENFAAQSNTNHSGSTGSRYQDMFIYSHAIYNTGTVVSAGTIQSGAFAQGIAGRSSNSFAHAFAYGIHGGNVTVTGGNIYSEAKSGFNEEYTSAQKKGNKAFNMAVGVYSNNAWVYGNAAITTKSTSWRDNTGDYNVWGDEGWNMSWGVGVMYSGTNYPYIGADVNINASFQHPGNSDISVGFPELGGKTAICSYTRKSAGDPDSYGRRAYAVAGVPASDANAMAGLQTGEVGPENALGVSVGGNASSTLYRTEFARYNNLTSTVSAAGESQSGANSGETKTSYITMGAPGNKAGGQYMLYYRYRNTSNTVTSASMTPNTAINNAVSLSPNTGVFTADQTTLTASGGGVKNSNFYEFLGTYHVAKTDGNYGTGVDCSKVTSKDVTTTGTPFTGSFNMSSNNSYIIWADYKAKAPTNIKVVAASTGNTINYLTTSTSFEVPYTGKAIVPGTDFNLGVIDMKNDTDIATDYLEDNTDATSYYAISGTDTSKVQLVYSYSADNGETYVSNALPKDVGNYIIKIVVPYDTDVNRAGAGNRNGGTFYINAKITKATPTIKGDSTKSGTYGSTIAELIPTSDYTIAGKSGETMTGTWSYSGYAATDYPEVGSGSQSVTLTWTPTGDCAKNYKAVDTTVTLSLAKRAVAVTPADSTVIYGTKTPSYVLNYTPGLTCDASKEAAWLAASTFQVNYNGSWQPYASTMLPGTYDMRIATFGGDTANNTFSTSGTAKLTINKAPLYYTATATGKNYDGNTSVNVVLSNPNGLGIVNGDSYTATISTTGNVSNANAGENKAVIVVTDGLEFSNSDKYYIAIQNNPSVTINKANPTATHSDFSFTYDLDRSLSRIDLSGEASVAGTWRWETPSIVPTVDVKTYYAIFEPVDATNYNTVKVPVTINVSKKEVVVSVDSMTIAYGDPAPALNLKYAGFTGSDSELNVATTGTVSASANYTMGNSVGVYPITITMTDYEANNYKFVAADNCAITVAKKNVVVTAPSTTVTYGDVAPMFNVTDLIVDADELYHGDSLVTLNDQAQFGITTTYVAGSSVGDYDVTISSNETENYTFTFVNGTVKVNKAVLTVTADNKTVDYGKQAPTLTATFSGYKFPDTDEAPTGAPVLTTQYARFSDAGEYAISIAVGTLSHPNYTFKVVGGTLTVNKLTLDTTGFVATATITHDEAYSEAVFTINQLNDNVNNITAAGTFALKDTTTIADYTNTQEDFLGKYVMATGIFTPTDSDNYNSVEVDVKLYINLHAITGAPVIKGTAMDGAELSVSVAGMSPSATDSYTYTWYVGNAQVGTGTTYTVKNSDIGKSIYVQAAAIESKGYKGTAKSSAVTAVEAFAKLVGIDQLVITDADAAYTYDGSTHEATVAVKSEFAGLVSDNITVYYNGSTSAPYRAGTYLVTIDVGVPNVPAGANRADYYGPVSGLEIGTIVINKAPVTATFSVADKIYDGTRKVNNYNVFISGSIEDDDVRLDVSAISIVFNKANAGEQKIDISGVKLVGNDIANYTLVIAETKATIEKATLKATATGVTRPYNGSAQVDVAFTNITGYASIDSSSTVYIEAGTAMAASANASEPHSWNITNINYTLSGFSAGNYVLEITNEATAQVTITKAVPTVVAPTVDGIVYNANRTLANIDLDEYYNRDGNGYWQFDDTTIVPTVKKTQYAATYISQNNNYANYRTNITVNVTPKTVTLTALDTVVSYGKAASYSVKADGFTGNDSLATMGGTQPTYVCVYSVGENVGEYTIKINHNLDSNGNYAFETVNGTLTVVPADLYVTATATNRDYNGSTAVEVKFAITAGKFANDDVVLSSTSTTGTAASANAGTRTVTYATPSITGVKAANYNLVVSPASGILTVKINKLNPDGVVFPSSATIEFGRDLSWAEFSDDAQGDGYFELVGDMPDDLGTFVYTVEFIPADNVNYNVLSANVALNVTICTVTPMVNITGKVQAGEKLSVSFTGLPSKAYDYMQYQWYRVSGTQNIAIANATKSVYSVTDADVGYQLVCVTYFDDAAPFKYNEDIISNIGEREGFCIETSGSVEEENLTFWQRIMKWIQSIIEVVTGLTFILGA